jgi:hypothetical protein
MDATVGLPKLPEVADDYACTIPSKKPIQIPSHKSLMAHLRRNQALFNKRVCIRLTVDSGTL